MNISHVAVIRGTDHNFFHWNGNTASTTFTMLTYGWQEDYELDFSGNIKCQSEMCLADSGA